MPVLLEVVRSIARVVSVPLTVDAEGGYSELPAIAADNVLRLAEAGAVGINLEDGAASPALTCEKIAAIRSRLAAAGVDVFINLRTDVYLRGLAPEGERLAETLRRAAAYRDAGADGLFVPLAARPEEISALAGQPLPLNLMAVPGLPAGEMLAALGVRRLSAGAALWTAALGEAVRLGRAFVEDGDASALFSARNLNGGWVNGLFTG